MIGVFDSGLGGLSVVRRLREVLPRHDVVYFADQAHVPYGDRAEPELLGLLAQNLAFLQTQGVNLIVTACNTSCAIADKYGWPAARVPVLDLIESAAIAVQQSGAKHIGVVATAATARSGTYARHIVARMPDAQVKESAAPALVPLVEAGETRGERAHAEVMLACSPLD
ncbi:MAG: glutamate racemase, partial [Candidatus Baltobacteraceae bacterium]